MKRCDALCLLDVTPPSDKYTLELVKEVRWPKKVFFVRTKVDMDVTVEMRKPSFDEAALLEFISTGFSRNLGDLLICPNDLFLISSYYPDKWDFRRLETAILDLHEQWVLRRLEHSFPDLSKVKTISGTGTNVILIWVTYFIS